MKLNGFVGTGTGKLGSSVFAVNAGEQIVRQYQPVVANPNTEAQVENRAKLKLASQLAAALAPVIAIPKKGMKSSRNLFISKNYRFMSASNASAQCSYENIQITNGSAALPQLTVNRAADNALTVALADNAGASVSRVVYALFRKSDEQQLEYIKSVVATSAGADGTYQASLGEQAGELVIYAYGMKDISAKASALYGELTVNNGEDIARLVISRTINSEDFALTKTRGCTLGISESSVDPVPDGSARVFVTSNGNGTVSGGGTFQIGQQVTVVATPASGYRFQCWKLNGSNSVLSSSASYTFTLAQQTDLVAYFEEDEGDGN